MIVLLFARLVKLREEEGDVVSGRLGRMVRLVVAMLLAVLALLPLPTAASPASDASPSLELVGQVGGRMGAIAVRGGLAYLAMGPRLVIADVSDGEHPRVIGRSEVLPGLVDDVAISGARAVVMAAGDAWIFDLSDPARPVLTGRYDTAEARGVRLSDDGELAYIVGSSFGLEIVDLSDPMSPRQVATSLSMRRQTYERSVQIAGHLAFVSGNDPAPRGQKTLRVVDVGDPFHPRTISGSDLPGDSEFAHVAVSNGRAYVTDAGQGWGGGRGSLTIFYVPSAGSLLPVSRLPSKPMRGVALSQEGAYAYAMTDEGMLVIDVRTEQAPSLVTVADVRGREVLVEESRAYVVADDRLTIVDLADPSRPNLLGQIQGFRCDDCKQLVIDGKRAMTSDRDALTIFDLDDPIQPRAIGRLPVDNGSRFAVSGDLMVTAMNLFGPNQISTGSKLQIVSLRDPHDPLVLTSLDFPDQTMPLAQPIALRGTMLCLLIQGHVSDPTILRTFDLSQPSAPRELGSIAIGLASSVALRGPLAFVLGTARMAVVDVSAPTVPRVIGEAQTSDKYGSRIFVRDHIYASTGGLTVIDVSDPGRPRQIGFLDVGSWSAAVDDEEQYALLNDPGLALVSLADPTAPTIVWSERQSYTNLGAVAYADGYFYVASRGGLSAYRVHTPEQ